MYIKEERNNKTIVHLVEQEKTERKLGQLVSILAKSAKLTQEAMNIALSLQTEEGKPISDFVREKKLNPVTFTDEQRAILFRKKKSKFFVNSHDLALQTLQYSACLYGLLDTIKEVK
jgi:hypothetical protein